MSEQQNSPGAYRSILKATSLLGGASAINMLVSIARAKVVAVLLGTAGMGVMGIYLSISGLATSLTACGLNYSGVRELAEARGHNDAERIGRTLKTFRTLTFWLGALGTAILASCAWLVSVASFGNASHSMPIAILSITVAANLFANYHVAKVQAAGQMTKVAAYNVISGVAGAVVAVVVFVVLRRDGIVPALVSGAMVQALLAWWFAHGIAFPQEDKGTSFDPEIARRLLRVGGLMVGIGLLAGFALFMTRALVVRTHGEAGAGVFQAAYGLSGMYAGYILGAMGTDFLPRLSAVSLDHAKMTRLVNEQTAIALWLGLPGVVGTIVLAPVLIPLFYSSEFADAIPVLQLMAVGVFGRLVSWPLSFGLIAKGAVKSSLISEFSAHATQLIVLWLTLPYFGLLATGAAAMASYAVYSWVVQRLLATQIGQRWSAEVWRALALGLIVMAAAISSAWLLPPPWQLACGGTLLGLTTLFCFARLSRISNVSHSTIALFIGRWCKPAGKPS